METQQTPEPTLSKDDNLFLHALGVFAVCLLAYVLLYMWDSRIRTGKGPWSISFDSTTNDTPRIVVNQPAYGITNVTLLFPGESVPLTNRATNILFTNPKMELPFGEIRHHDLSYQPGVITLLAFNHEIEFIRRGLFIDRREIKWPDADTITLTPTNQPPPRHPERKRTKDLEQ